MYERIALLAEARARGELSALSFHAAKGNAPAASAGAVDGTGLNGAHVPCQAGTLSVVVDERGEVRPCEVLGASFGNLREVGMDFRRIWESPPAKSARQWIRESRCACTWECAAATNLLFTPGIAPRILARALRS